MSATPERRERLFELRLNGEILHLVGRDQVAELIGLLGQSLVDATEVDGEPIERSWTQRWDHHPIKMECRHMLMPMKEIKKLKNGAAHEQR
jgi:hypothetical protein